MSRRLPVSCPCRTQSWRSNIQFLRIKTKLRENRLFWSNSGGSFFMIGVCISMVQRLRDSLARRRAGGGNVRWLRVMPFHHQITTRILARASHRGAGRLADAINCMLPAASCTPPIFEIELGTIRLMDILIFVTIS